MTNLLETIGNTPLVSVPIEGCANVMAKLEYLNPGGSIKDRPALFMVEDAEKKGLLKPGGTIIEASSGNQGIALAMIGAVKGYRVIITVSEKVSEEKVKTLKAFGAEVVMCPIVDALEDPRGYYGRAKALHESTPNSFMPDQHHNPMNMRAHYATTGPEIWEQTGGKVTHVFAAAGTCGTIAGVGKYLKERNPAIKVIAVDAANSFYSTKGNPKPYKVEGVGIDFDAPLFDTAVIDEVIPVTDDEAFAMLKTLAKKGFLVGPSSGAVAATVQRTLPRLTKNDLAVMIFGDSGRAYLSKGYYR